MPGERLLVQSFLKVDDVFFDQQMVLRKDRYSVIRWAKD